MKQVTIHIPDNKYSLFMEFAKNISFIKKIEAADKPSQKQVLKNIKTGLEEVELFKKGKLKTTTAKDFLNEL